MSALTHDEILKHEQHLQKYVELSERYANSRGAFGRAKYKLHVILTANLSKIREQKSNVGMDMALLMLLEPNFLEDVYRQEVLQYYKDYIECEEAYKGLEHLIEATKTQIMYAQSVMKYIKDVT